MSAFVDETAITVQSGSGGAGSTSFRREKYVPKGGPDGGDGGRGGNVVFVTRRNLTTLAHIRGRRVYNGRSGGPGRGRKMHGRNGDDALIEVPPGTLVSNSVTGELLHDCSKEGERWICLQGGQGGLGNWHFRSSRNQRPTYAQQGRPGESLELKLELKVIADVGLIGKPSVGKSSLINALTAARSRVAAWPFTTKIPSLGVLRRGECEIVIADIPGLVEGASAGVGMGHQFLKHVSRTGILAYLADLGEENPAEDFKALYNEVSLYDPALSEKERIIIASKSDLDPGGDKLKQLKSSLPNETVLGVSVFTRQGLNEAANAFIERGSSAR